MLEGVLSLSIPYFDLLHIVVVCVRVGAALMFAPIWGYPGLPNHLRIVLIFSTAIIIASITPVSEPAYMNPELILPVEFLIGLLLGTGIRIAIAGLHLGGQMIGYHLGYSAAQTIDPTTANRSTLMSGFIVLTGYALILATNQHHTLLRALADSYRVFPVGSAIQPGQWFDTLFNSAAQIFIIGWRIALPVFVVTLVVELTVGVIARMQPQISTLVVTAPLKLCVGLLALGASLAFLPRAIGSAMDLMVLHK